MSVDGSYILERTLLPTKVLEVKFEKGPYFALTIPQYIKKQSVSSEKKGKSIFLFYINISHI